MMRAAPIAGGAEAEPRAKGRHSCSVCSPTVAIDVNNQSQDKGHNEFSIQCFFLTDMRLPSLDCEEYCLDTTKHTKSCK